MTHALQTLLENIVSANGEMRYDAFAAAMRSFNLQEAVKDDDYTVVEADRGSLVVLDKATAIALSLPAVATAGAGFQFFAANINTGGGTVDPDGAETINGASTLAIPQGAFARIWVNAAGDGWRAEIGFDPAKVVFTGGTMDGVAIGGTTPAAGAFTTLSATGVASFADGAAGTPSITFASDGNTGLFSVSADVLGVAVGGSQVARFNQYGFGAGIAPDASYVLASKKDASGLTGIYHENLHASGQAALRVTITGGKYCQISSNTTGDVAGFLTNQTEFYVQNAASSSGNIRLQTVNGGSVRIYGGASVEVLRTFSDRLAIYKPFGSSPVAVSALPAASLQAGLRATVNDATVTTFASVVVGGGSETVPVYSDGTNWKIG